MSLARRSCAAIFLVAGIPSHANSQLNDPWIVRFGAPDSIAGADLTLGDSWGFAAHSGLDFRINERWLAGVALRWINIDTEAKVNGASVGSVHIDPLVYGGYVSYRF